MGLCEMCGKEGQLFETIVESSRIKTCKDCGSYGNVIQKVKPPRPARPVIETPQPVFELVSDFASLIRTKREQLGMTQERFAQKLQEKESVVRRIEGNQFTPNLVLANKIERLLRITLVEESKDDVKLPTPQRSNTLTIGDVISSK